MDGTILCQPSSGQENDWQILYESAFPQDERTPIEELRKLLAAGTILLHRTVNKSGELLCFSIVYPMSGFDFLSYIATDTTKRSSGFGSKHMKRLIEILKERRSDSSGLFLEIESTKEPGLDADTLKARQRRLAFYQRLGAKRLCKDYFMLSYTPNGAPRPGELLWIDIGNGHKVDVRVPEVISEIFLRGYFAPVTDPTLLKVLAQFPTAESGLLSNATCPVESQPSTPTTPTDGKTTDTPKNGEQTGSTSTANPSKDNSGQVEGSSASPSESEPAKKDEMRTPQFGKDCNRGFWCCPKKPSKRKAGNAVAEALLLEAQENSVDRKKD